MNVILRVNVELWYFKRIGIILHYWSSCFVYVFVQIISFKQEIHLPHSSQEKHGKVVSTFMWAMNKNLRCLGCFLTCTQRNNQTHENTVLNYKRRNVVRRFHHSFLLMGRMSLSHGTPGQGDVPWLELSWGFESTRGETWRSILTAIPSFVFWWWLKVPRVDGDENPPEFGGGFVREMPLMSGKSKVETFIIWPDGDGSDPGSFLMGSLVQLGNLGYLF